jgi:hypothetical protein
MLWLLSNWRPIAFGGVALMVAGLLLAVRHEHAVATRAKAEASAQRAQAQTNAAVNTATDHYVHDVTVLHDHANQAADQIRKAPTANEALDPAYRSTLCDELGRVRGTPVCDETNPDGARLPS